MFSQILLKTLNYVFVGCLFWIKVYFPFLFCLWFQGSYSKSHSVQERFCFLNLVDALFSIDRISKFYTRIMHIIWKQTPLIILGLVWLVILITNFNNPLGTRVASFAPSSTWFDALFLCSVWLQKSPYKYFCNISTLKGVTKLGKLK